MSASRGSNIRGQLYILGTSHPLQCGSAQCSPDKIEDFEAELRTICKSYSIQCIAEEMNREGLGKHNVTATVAERLAKLQGLQHCYVDLTSDERKMLSLDESSFVSAITRFPFKDGGAAFRDAFDKMLSEVRERCWSARILAKNQWPTLLICGANHSRNMQTLWSHLELSAIIVREDYEP